MIRFINEHRDHFGVELICQVLRPAVKRIPDFTRLSSCCGQGAVRAAVA